MNSDNLKKILKPLIKQCVKEVIFEEGALSSIIQEVVSGLSAVQPIVESTNTETRTLKRKEDASKRLLETKKKMLDSIGKGSYGNVDVFEGTAPLSSGGSPGAPPASSPLANIDPRDPGIDISGLFGNLSENWKKMV